MNRRASVWRAKWTASVVAAVVVVGVVAGVAGDAQADRRHGESVIVDRDRHLKAVNQLLEDIEELLDRNEDNPDKRARKWTRERLEAMGADLRGVRADLQSAPPAGFPPPPPPPLPPPPFPPPSGPVHGAAMTPAEFASFQAELKKQTFDSNRLGLVKEVAAEAWFTTDQVIQTMSHFSFSGEKIQAAAAMYPHVVDRERWYSVYSTLTFSSDQEKLRKLTSGTPAR